MVLKRFNVLSVGKVLGCLYAGLGLIVGFLFSMFAFLGFAAGSLQGQGGEALIGVLFGLGAVFFFPVFYGILGFIGGLIASALYNLISSLIGGIEFDLDSPGEQS